MKQTYRIKFASGDADLVLDLPPTESCSTVIAEVRRQKAVPPFKHIRLICAGKELRAEDPLYRVTSLVLHCMITNTLPVRALQAAAPADPPPAPPPTRTQQLLDWLDTVDPGVVLMWVFGSILVFAWLLLLFCPHLYDRNSIVVLCMMSIVFLIPCGLSYFMFYHPYGRPAGRPANPYDPAYGTSTSVAPWSHSGMVIPPRPHARVRGPNSPMGPAG